MEANGEATASKNVPVGQVVQKGDPMPSAYEPMPHGTHDRPPVEEDTYPGLQSVQFEVPEPGATWPRGHGSQDAAPDDNEYAPGAHTLHVVAPAALKLPGAQDRQSPRLVAPAKGLAVPAGHVMHDALPWPEIGL